MPRSKDLADLREMTPERLQEELKNTRNEFFSNRVRWATRNLDHPEPLRRARKRIAQILTLLREHELKEAGRS